ncbi:MAG TPA: hypothetical protein VF335_04540 [Chitinivibrionales bacterium]
MNKIKSVFIGNAQPFLSAAALILFAVTAVSSQTFDLISLEGSAKVQRVQKKEWENLAVGSQLHDNDIVESGFQTKGILRFGKGNIVIIGSNSKALINIRERESSPGTSLSDVNITLFSGACFVKAISQAHIGVYTSNAVGETENGSFSAVVESKTGETGFQVLGGKVRTRNIAQKEGIDLTSGQTTMIFPGKEPTAPLYITYKHVSVLKHFFGDEYIQSEMEVAGIKPTEDKTSRSATLLSDAMANGQFGNSQNLTTYKIPFSLNKIYGAILDDRAKNKRTYIPLTRTGAFDRSSFTLRLRGECALANGGVNPCFQAIPSYALGAFNIGLRLSLSANYTGSLGLYDFSSGAGILDLIDHVLWAPAQSPFAIAIGSLNDVTIGNGLVVNRFNNRNPYAVFQPLGFYGKLNLEGVSAETFIADMSQFSLGGVHLNYDFSRYRLGAGYYFDANQYQNITPLANNRFRLFPDTIAFKPPDSLSLNANIYELNFSFDAVSSEELIVEMGGDFAQKLGAAGNDGFIFDLPSVSVDWDRFRVSASLVSEFGRLLVGQFNSFYMANRWRIDSSAAGDTLLTQNTILSTGRSCQGIALSCAFNPFVGAGIELSVRQNLREKHSFHVDTAHVDTAAMAPGTDFSLSLCVNDSLFKAIRYGELYVRQEHTGLFPPRSSVFASWEFQAGLAVTTNPLFFGIAVDADIAFGFLDMNVNNKIDPGDLAMMISACFTRSF